jgi:hypothetical protein
MSAHQASAATAIALQLVAALDAYQADVASLAAPCVAPESYQRLRLRLDEMRGYAAALPDVSVAWVELLIRHFELAHALWKHQHGGAGEDLDGLHDRHRESVARLRARCLLVLQQDGMDAR